MENYIIETRRALHKIPESDWDLPETTAYIQQELDDMGLNYRKIKESGFIVKIDCGKENAKTYTFRTDMDALNVTEETGAEYSSRHAGKMHACGHDGHMAMMLGFLKSIKEKELPCNVVAIFQPGEENVAGAREFAKEPEILNSDAIFAIHLWTPLDSGKVSATPGPRMASADNFDFRIFGESTHGGEPHRGIDPIPAAAACVQAIQTYVSRRLDPNSSAVITIGQICGGTAHNIVAPYVDIGGTVRAFDPRIRENIYHWLEQTVSDIAKAYSCKSESSWFFGSPAVINDEKVTEIARAAAEKAMGHDSLLDMPRVFGGEDFAIYQENVPGCLIFLGAKTKDYYPHHHPMFNIDETVLKKGAEIFENIVFSCE